MPRTWRSSSGRLSLGHSWRGPARSSMLLVLPTRCQSTTVIPDPPAPPRPRASIPHGCLVVTTCWPVGVDERTSSWCDDGLEIPRHIRRTFVAQGSGLTRGDRNRNRKIEALRGVVRRDRAVLAVDRGEDKQAAGRVEH